ncbi:MAG: YaiI/YqxD family protein [Proteobacteria bacterium]|nr:YaiI/YqxD family protein [Pseudomonadota bacterium]
MHIWVDADACPNTVKEILYRAAARTGIPLTLVANQYLRTPPSPLIRAIQVEGGFDVADDYIAENCSPADLVITADIPLAASIMKKNAHALNPRGEFYTDDNIRERVAMRNFMDQMRASGVQTGGPPALNDRDKQKFANALDAFLARNRPG